MNPPGPAALPVLVTGGTGFVGSHLVDRLVAAGFSVRCLVRPTSSLAWLPRGIHLVYGDLAAGTGLREAVAGVGLVFHAAGVTKAKSARQYYSGNVRTTENLLRAVEESGAAVARFVHVSSLAAIGPSPDGSPLHEDAPPRPQSHYGKSKLESEEAVRRSPLCARAVIVRPPVVYGPRDTDVLEFFRAVRRGLLVRIGRTEAYFSAIHAADLAEGLLAAAQCGPAGGTPYFLANAGPVSWTEFGLTAAGIMGRQVRTVSLPFAAAYSAGWLAEIASLFRKKPGILSREKVLEARHAFWTCDPSLARRQLGFEARRSLQEGIAETLDWYKMVGWLKF